MTDTQATQTLKQRIEQLEAALQAVWTVATDLVETHGQNGSNTLTDAQHQNFQEAGALANRAINGAGAVKASEPALPFTDLITHRSAWRNALKIAQQHAEVKAPDIDDKAYWAHELRAFDRTFQAIDQAVNDGAGNRVLILVRGGNADYITDNGPDVEIFDWDNYHADPEATGGVPARFADLARRVGVPVDGERGDSTAPAPANG